MNMKNVNVETECSFYCPPERLNKLDSSKLEINIPG